MRRDLSRQFHGQPDTVRDRDTELTDAARESGSGIVGHPPYAGGRVAASAKKSALTGSVTRKSAEKAKEKAEP